MRIVAANARTLHLGAPVRNSTIKFDDMTATALVLQTDATENRKPLFGLAFDSIGRYDHSGLLRDRFIPRLLAADPQDYADDEGGIDPTRVWSILMKNEKPGGHGERCGAVGLIDAAVWDLLAKRAGVPLWRLLSDLEGTNRQPAAAVYVSGGHYRAHEDIEFLCDDVRRAMGRGHLRFKIKIGGAEIGIDIKRIDAVLRILGPQMRLAVDANGGFDLDTATSYAQSLSKYPLMWLEEPFNPLDYESHRELAERSDIPLAVGENLFSADDARNLLRYGGLRPNRDLLQFDISLSYGLVEYRRILGELAERGWQRSQCAPHAGHLLAFNAVAGLGLGFAEVAMDTTSLFGRLTSNIEITEGAARLPDVIGAGFEATSVYEEIFGELLG
jgi:L-alanine-DL-glutamate epimerase-like enolase superfamily enzyme